MANSTTKTSIMDRALQLLGFGQISSPQQVGSRGAKAISRAYDATLLSELQKNYWAFAIKRVSIPKSATKPTHTKANAYPLPGDFIMLAPEDITKDFQIKNDWIIEGNSIISDDSSPLEIRYVSSDITENMFSPIFAEALSAALAVSCGEELTNSSGKLQRVAAIYEAQIELARRRNAIIVQKQSLPASPWITKRG